MLPVCFGGGSQTSLFNGGERERDVVLFYERPRGFLNVSGTQRVCPVTWWRALMLFFYLFGLFSLNPPQPHEGNHHSP